MPMEDEKVTDQELMRTMERLCKALELLIEEQNLLIDHLVEQKNAVDAEFFALESCRSSGDLAVDNVIWLGRPAGSDPGR